MSITIKSWSGRTIYVSETMGGVREALAEALRSDADRSDADRSGADFSGANLSGTDLRGTDLRGANLRGTDLRGTDLRGTDLSDADLRGTDLSDADLNGANLNGANLSGANLRGTNLRGTDLSDADLRGAEGLPPIPAILSIDAAILAAISRPKAGLEMADWHRCETTHCRAGWAVHLAGEPGYTLEKAVGPAAAGALIYAASGSHPTPNFYCGNEEALADIKVRAGRAG